VTAFDELRHLLGPRRLCPDSSLTICTDATGTGGVSIFVHGTRAVGQSARPLTYFIDAFRYLVRGCAGYKELATGRTVEGFGTWLRQTRCAAITWRTDSSSAQSS
jgi:hypothetical protein